MSFEMSESLPASILETAIKTGNEFGWRKKDVKDVIRKAQSENFGCLGGQVQFVFPDKTYELYWCSYDPDEKMSGEQWSDYVDRSCKRTIESFEQLLIQTDLIAEGLTFPSLKEKEESGIRLEDHMIFVLYFVNEKDYPQ